MTSQRSAATPFEGTAGLRYGWLGLPLAFVALPLYVVLPYIYASQSSLSLTAIGLVLMAIRLSDAFIEPLVGRVSDLLYRYSLKAVLGISIGAGLLQIVGMTSLFFPTVEGAANLVTWMAVWLFITCLAHSLLTITHQAWGVRLGGDDVQRSRIVAWREGFGLVGVITASALSLTAGPAAMISIFALSLAVGLWLWARAPRPARQRHVVEKRIMWRPLRSCAFRRLLAIFMCNGIASAIPAALMLFYAKDKLQADDKQIAFFLTVYFLAGALSMPGWLWLTRRIGMERAWLTGMVMATVSFAWTITLTAGDLFSFSVICALTGLCLGADLSLPGALLARLIGRLGDQGRHDGAYLGWWNLATKLNLALAAGATLPLLEHWGYQPGSLDPTALTRLTWTYALAPCLLKIMAAALLYGLFIRRLPSLSQPSR